MYVGVMMHVRTSLTADDLSSCDCEVAHILCGNLKIAKLRMRDVTHLGKKTKGKISKRLHDQQTICLLVRLFQKVYHSILWKRTAEM